MKRQRILVPILSICTMLLFLLWGCSGENLPLHMAWALDRLEHGPIKRTPGPYTTTVPEMYPGNPQAQALVTAAMKGDVKEIDRLIDAGADPNAVGAYGMTVPGWLLYHPNKAGFRRLLERGADPNIIWEDKEDFYRESLIHKAARLSGIIGVDYLKMCLKIGKGNPNLESPDHKHRPIEEAVSPDRNAAFVVLYKAGAEIDFPIEGVAAVSSLVQSAACDWNYRLVFFMLQRGVSYSYGTPNTDDMQHTIQANIKGFALARNPASPQYMWFWRCVDFLEKRGMVFDYTPGPNREPAIRPAVLDTTQPDICGPARRQ